MYRMKDFYVPGKKRKWQAKDETIKIKYASNYMKGGMNQSCACLQKKSKHDFHETAISFLMVRLKENIFFVWVKMNYKRNAH